jgi:hypothetical protein|tara:strand:- start:608 stop:1114 length:507 start_codon:yes stop_codon:yes gene_type:complete
MKKKKRLECEFSDKELDSWVQEFRRACQDDPDPNEEQFPSNAEDMHEHIVLLEHLVKKNPTQELKEDLRVYKALRSGAFIGHATATEWLMKRSDEIKSKATIIDGKPMTDEQFEDIKKSVSDDPNTPKGHWEGGEYYFDKETPELTEEELIEAGIDPSRYMTKKKKNI